MNTGIHQNCKILSIGEMAGQRLKVDHTDIGNGNPFSDEVIKMMSMKQFSWPPVTFKLSLITN